MTKEMFWLLMGHLVCIGQWAAFIMVDHAFLVFTGIRMLGWLVGLVSEETIKLVIH